MTGDRGHLKSNGSPKVRYSTPSAAAYQRRMMKMYLGVKPNIYRCSTCSMWHVGNKPQSYYDRQNASRDEALAGKVIGALKAVLNS